ncbi:MAG TPA: hypothetical protein VLL54_21810 [Pyrinomonadaceae bacterium]|nr:hypothetical protein [Pyrinomonadaceae bacterium]
MKQAKNSNLVTSLAALALLVCVAAPCKQLKSIGNPTVVKSADGKFQITVPAGWQQDAFTSTKTDMKAGNLADELYVMVINERKSDFTDETTLDDYTKLVRDATMENLIGPQGTQPLPLTINGNQGRQYEIQGSTKNVKIAYLITTVETGEFFHQIVTWTLASRKEQNEAKLLEVTNSFRSTQ